MTDLIVFADPVAAAITALRSGLAGTPFDGTVVGDRYGGGSRALQVSTDGGPQIAEGYMQTVRLRINAWHTGPSHKPVADLCRLASAVLVAAADNDGPFAAARHASGPLDVTTDDDTYPHAFFGVEVVVRREETP